MCVIDGDGVVSFANKQFERMFGVIPDKTESGTGIFSLIAPDPGKIQEFSKRHEEVLRGSGSPVVFESRARGAEGSHLSVLVTMVVLPSTSQVAVSLIDLTLEKEYERELAERAERLEHFMTIASHELRHPITIIKGYTTILSNRGSEIETKGLEDIYGTMEFAADRLTSMVDELMDVSRFEKIDLVTDMREVDLETLISIAVERIDARGFENTINILVERDAAYAEVDPEKIVQLLIILIENAVSYSPVRSAVDIELARGSGTVVLSVMDRGPGIPPEHGDKVFERFYQVADAMHHSTPGLGLGLYIARKIVAAHGGELTYEPRSGGGSVFRVSLPRD